MFKKTLCLLALVALLAVPLAGACFAADDETGDNIVCDKDYPDYGFRAHSWVAGDVAYTQIIDAKSGAILKQTESKIVPPAPPAF